MQSFMLSSKCAQFFA